MSETLAVINGFVDGSTGALNCYPYPWLGTTPYVPPITIITIPYVYLQPQIEVKRTGWLCSKCQKSWSPEVKGCEHCNK